MTEFLRRFKRASLEPRVSGLLTQPKTHTETILMTSISIGYGSARNKLNFNVTRLISPLTQILTEKTELLLRYRRTQSH